MFEIHVIEPSVGAIDLYRLDCSTTSVTVCTLVLGRKGQGRYRQACFVRETREALI